MEAAQAVKSDTVTLVSKYASHVIREKELDRDGKYKLAFELKFRNGRCVLSRKEYERLSKIPAFANRIGLGKSIGVIGLTLIQPKEVPIPDVVTSVGSKQEEE